MEYTGKHEDFDEEQYKILLDSGEELEGVNESFFKKIKSAKKMTNADLPDSTQRYSFETMSFDEFADEMDIANCPACDGPGMLLGTLGTRVHYRCRNCGLDFSHKEEPEAPMDVMPPEVPPAMPAAPAPQGPAAPGMPGPTNVVNERAVLRSHTAKWNDSNGQPLAPGAWYRMHHKGYKVPDLVRILNLEDNRIEAAIDTDVKGAFPIIIGDDHEYSFEPITKEAEYISDSWLDDDVPEWEGEPEEFNPRRDNTFTPGDRVSTGSAEGIIEGVEEGAYGAIYQVRFQDGQVQAVGGNALQLIDPNVSQVPDTLPFDEAEQEYYRSASNWRISRKKFSPSEQRALIEENLEGRARNMEKLDLTGTHYELKDADLDPDFLWGM